MCIPFHSPARRRSGLRRALVLVHRQYAGHIHAREKRTGHFWQGRFGAVGMEEGHLAAALRYVVLNLVRAHPLRLLWGRGTAAMALVERSCPFGGA
jgi:REP element-mobilizing transposase RayT